MYETHSIAPEENFHMVNSVIETMNELAKEKHEEEHRLMLEREEGEFQWHDFLGTFFLQLKLSVKAKIDFFFCETNPAEEKLNKPAFIPGKPTSREQRERESQEAKDANPPKVLEVSRE